MGLQRQHTPRAFENLVFCGSLLASFPGSPLAPTKNRKGEPGNEASSLSFFSAVIFSTTADI